MRTMTDHQTYSTREACERMGVTYRIADYWCRTGVLSPSVAAAEGSGSHRRWSADDVRVGQALAQLGRLGASGSMLGEAAESLRLIDPEAWPSTTVVVDGMGTLWAPESFPGGCGYLVALGRCEPPVADDEPVLRAV